MVEKHADETLDNFLDGIDCPEKLKEETFIENFKEAIFEFENDQETYQ